MPWWFWLIVAFVLLAGYVTATSNRLDRLHARLDATRAALDAQLLRRAAVTLEIAASGMLDPATSVLLASAGHEARAATGEDADREVVESRLTVALRAAFADPDEAQTLCVEPTGVGLLAELEAATTKVLLARRFSNDAVTATLAIRRHRLVRWLRLAGRVSAPTFFEMDDEPPAYLAVAEPPLNGEAGEGGPDVD
ncbi:MAG TPA: hypothetical protein VGD55_14635 [Acidothermaceae bacterium]